MRTSILLIRKHGSKAFELLAGPEVPVHEQDEEFCEALMANGIHPEIAELQKWEGDSGHYRTLKFVKPDEMKARREKIESDHAAYVEKQKPKKAAKSAKADAPKADAPKADAPKADAPKADAPKADAPKADAPKEPQVDL